MSRLLELVDELIGDVLARNIYTDTNQYREAITNNLKFKERNINL